MKNGKNSALNMVLIIAVIVLVGILAMGEKNGNNQGAAAVTGTREATLDTTTRVSLSPETTSTLGTYSDIMIPSDPESLNRATGGTCTSVDSAGIYHGNIINGKCERVGVDVLARNVKCPANSTFPIPGCNGVPDLPNALFKAAQTLTPTIYQKVTSSSLIPDSLKCSLSSPGSNYLRQGMLIENMCVPLENNADAGSIDPQNPPEWRVCYYNERLGVWRCGQCYWTQGSSGPAYVQCQYHNA